MQTLTPQQESIKNLWAFNMSSIARFDSHFIINDILPRERARNAAKRAAGETLMPRDMVYLRAALDTLEGRGVTGV